MEFVWKKHVVLQVHLHEILKDYYKNNFYKWIYITAGGMISHR